MVPGRAAVTGAVPQRRSGLAREGPALPECGRLCLCTFATRGCSHVCGVAAAALYVCLGGPLGTFWPPTGLQPPSPAPSPLISCSEGIVISWPACGCGQGLGRSCDYSSLI